MSSNQKKDGKSPLKVDRRKPSAASALMLKELKIKNKQLINALNKIKTQSTQLIQTEKMNALGMLTAGIAHELNNPLMGILNFVQYGIQHTQDSKKVNEVLIDAEAETKRCIKIIKYLLSFSRSEESQQEAYQRRDCSEIFDIVLKLINYHFRKENIEVIKQYDPDVPAVPMFANKIQQVFLNLLSNALDALKNRKNKKITINITKQKEYVKISIKDTGCGIALKNLQKVFEPFFTTKPVGRGTGLGLSVSHGIIEEHGGRLAFTSKLGKGTTFNVLLPIKSINKETGKEIIND